MTLYGDTDVQVYVTLRAPRSVMESLRPEDFHATVDINQMEEGAYRLPIQVQVDREPVRILEVEPPEITLYLEPTTRMTVPVSVRLEGNTAIGYIPRPPIVNPLTTTVSGPASLVSQVVEAVAVISVEGERADIEGSFELVPQDERGSVIPYVVLDPAEVAVHVPIEKLSGFLEVAVTALLEGQVASGYRISSITVDPPLVTVYGPPDAIEQIPGYLQTVPLNLEGAKGDITAQLPLVVPEGVSLVGMDEPVVTVQVSIVPLEGSLTVERKVEIQGMEPGFTATVAPETVEVILSGPVPVLEQLTDEDVRVLVDLLGLNPGIHSLEPQVVAPPEVVTEAVIPSSVQVEVILVATPTPER
jgi:YbbR domain-containing protein